MLLYVWGLSVFVEHCHTHYACVEKSLPREHNPAESALLFWRALYDKKAYKTSDTASLNIFKTYLAN